jgi:uncharacterized protein (DUF1015 family)
MPGILKDGMAERSVPPLVTAFAAERFAALDRLSEFVAPPYDVIDAAQRETLAARDPHNIVHLTLPEGRPDPSAAAAKLLARWRQEGVLVRDPSPHVYVVQQGFLTLDGRSHVRTGVIAAVHVEPYATGRVRPHERTHAGPKEGRLALARATCATLEPIFLLARDERGHLRRRLDGVTRHEPVAMAELDGVGIGLWKVGGLQGAEIARVAGEGALYIADGHHRFETANSYRAENPAAERLPGLIVPVADPGLVVLSTHRIVTGAPFDPTPLLARWERRFQVEPREAELDPQGLLDGLEPRPAALVVLPGGRLFAVTSRDAGPGELEIAVIEREVVGPVMDAIGARAAITYSANPGEAFDAVGRGMAAAAVLVRPTPVEQVLGIADAGGVMPPKSTYFAPKVPSGLVMMSHEA